MKARLTSQHAFSIQRLAASFKVGNITPLKMFQWILGRMASAVAVLQLGLLQMRPPQYWLKPRVSSRAWTSGHFRLKVTQGCIEALEPWKTADWYQSGVDMGTVSKLKVVSTDASNLGWCAL